MSSGLERYCLVHRKQESLENMIRIAKLKDSDKLIVDKDFVLKGRGAYFCKTKEAWQQVLQKRLLNRAFRRNVPNTFYVTIKKELEELWQKQEKQI